MNDRDVIERSLRLGVMAIYWAKTSVTVAINTKHGSLKALAQKMDDTVREAKQLVVAARALGHLTEADRDRWLALIDEAAKFGKSGKG